MNPTVAAFDLTDWTAVVTGAAAGFGARIAEVLAAAGAAVVCADLNGDGAATVAEWLTARGWRAWSAQCDVASAESVAALGRPDE